MEAESRKKPNEEYLRQEFYATQINHLVHDLMDDSLEYADRKIKIKKDPEDSIVTIDFLRRQGRWLLFSIEVINSQRLRVSEPTLVNDVIDEFINEGLGFKKLPEDVEDDEDEADEFDPIMYRGNPDIGDLNISLHMFSFNNTKFDPHGLHAFVNIGYLISELQRRLVIKSCGLKDFSFGYCDVSEHDSKSPFPEAEPTMDEQKTSFMAFIETGKKFPLSMRGVEATVGYTQYPGHKSDYDLVVNTIEDLRLITNINKIRGFLGRSSFPLKDGFWFNKTDNQLTISCGPKTPWWHTEN